MDKEIKEVKIVPCFKCGKPVKLEYPQFYDIYADKEVCEDCFIKQGGFYSEPHFI